ncbi:unnamed protein product, partial [Ranitomeya imitator]
MTPNTSRLCKGYPTKKESDGGLHQMTWPPQSQDLNPIEMIIVSVLDYTMAETCASRAASPPAEPAAKSKKQPKKTAAGGAKKSKKPSGPSVSELIVKAVSASKERSGVSLAALKKALSAGGYDVEKNNSRLKLAVRVWSPRAPSSRKQETKDKVAKKKPAAAAKPKKPAAAKKAAKSPKKPKKAPTAAKKSPKKAKKPAAAAAKKAKSPKKPKAAPKPKKVRKSPAKKAAKAKKPAAKK